jgi:hypothetical protein
MSKVVSLTDKLIAEDDAKQERIVRMLEKVTELAREGKIHAVGIAWVNDDRSTGNAWCAPFQQHSLTASMMYLIDEYKEDVNKRR